MAPRPYENNFRVRLSKTGSLPAIYAISSGPQKGVHMLSSEPLPPSLQYMYRHPINIHTTFLDVTGDFLRRRFDSIEAAQTWIDEMDALRRRHEADDELADRLAEGLSLSAAPTPAAAARERRMNGVFRSLPDSVRVSGEGLRRSEVLDGMRGGFRVAKRKGGAYSRSHTGAARREVVGVLTRRHSEADVEAATRAVEAVAIGRGDSGSLKGEEVAMED